MSKLTITIEKATPENAEAAAILTLMALGSSAKELLGTTCKDLSVSYLMQLWGKKKNRFSHVYSYIAKQDNKPVGLMTCFPGEMTGKTIFPTMRQLIRIGKLRFIRHILSQIKLLKHFSSHVEAHPDEFYIRTLAVLPEYQGMSIGTQLLDFMRIQAKAAGLAKCALLVDADNANGIRFYERHGFNQDGYWEKPVPFYRMVAKLPIGGVHPS